MKKVVLLLVLLYAAISSVGQDYQINLTERWWNRNPDGVLQNKRLQNAIDTFFKHKNKETLRSFCTPSDQRLWGTFPFKEIRFKEGWFGEKYPLRPSILGAVEVDSTSSFKKYLVKIAYIANEDSVNNSIGCIYNFLVNLHSDGAGFSFERYSSYLLDQWYKKQVGNILYYKADQTTFNTADAIKMNSFNDSIAKIWNVDPLKCVYFSCKNTVELFQLQGFDFVVNMFLAKTGGQASCGGKGSEFEHILYSGNNKEYYPHEICHFYINTLITQECSRLAEEGIATFLGGSSEQSYSYHARALKLYLDKNPEKSVVDLFSDNSKINEHTSILYATGAVIADMVYEKKGLEGFKKFLAISEKELKEKIPEMLGASSEKVFKDAFYKKLKQYE